MIGVAHGSTTKGVLLGVALTFLIGGAAVWFARGSGLRIDTSRPAVIRRIQELQRLETVVFGMDKIVSGGQESRYLGMFALPCFQTRQRSGFVRRVGNNNERHLCSRRLLHR